MLWWLSYSADLRFKAFSSVCGDSILRGAYSMTTMMTMTTMTMMMMSVYCDGCLAVQTPGLDRLSQLW